MIRFHAAAQIITLDDFMPQHAVIWEYEKIPVTWKRTGQIQMYFNEGLNSLDEERYDLAVENFTRVIELDNNNWQAYYYRGVALKMMMRLG
ncbi:MAG: tetratricopeptide repeat protein [Cyclobacteriaceae bacterium]|nr:tetratricopeptide repeat protein [Cyclobacteriaceae bacterium]MCX7636350.1 tetratricopeptide repeat protein [Cyclobacteriaceae bacterium]MDW8330293.1 tetratricopeptide repeat protein [Cyclobacteriaceae bacterium]